MAFVIGPGFKAKVDELGWTPDGPEIYFAQVDAAGNSVPNAPVRLSMLKCKEGILWYDNIGNTVGATPFA